MPADWASGRAISGEVTQLPPIPGRVIVENHGRFAILVHETPEADLGRQLRPMGHTVYSDGTELYVAVVGNPHDVACYVRVTKVAA